MFGKRCSCGVENEHDKSLRLLSENLDYDPLWHPFISILCVLAEVAVDPTPRVAVTSTEKPTDYGNRFIRFV